MIISSTSVTFSLEHLKPITNCQLDLFEYRAYSDPKLCILECVKEYIHRKNERVDKEKRGYL